MANGRFKCVVCGKPAAHLFNVEGIADCRTAHQHANRFSKRSCRTAAVCDECQEAFVTEESERVAIAATRVGVAIAGVTINMQPIHQPEEIWDRMSENDREMWAHRIGAINLESGRYEQR